MQKRRDACANAFEKNFGKTFPKPSSSLYLFVALQALGLPANDSNATALELLEKANIATVPGVAFGQEGYLRSSFGDVSSELEAAVAALSQYCSLRQ
jgi:aspartate/methionine/tyrosine aminotransferase